LRRCRQVGQYTLSQQARLQVQFHKNEPLLKILRDLVIGFDGHEAVMGIEALGFGLVWIGLVRFSLHLLGRIDDDPRGRARGGAGDDGDADDVAVERRRRRRRSA